MASIFDYFFSRDDSPRGTSPIGFGNPVHNFSGITVTHQTARTVSAYFAAVQVIAEDLAKLPARVVRRDGPRREQLNDHPVTGFFSRQPNENTNAYAFKEGFIATALEWGRAFAEIERVGSRPVALHYIHPTRVTMKTTESGMIAWEVADRDSSKRTVLNIDMLHLMGPTRDGITGLNMIELVAESMGISLATRRHAATFFGNGAHFKFAIVHPGALKTEQVKQLREAWQEKHGGNASFSPPVLSNGVDLKNFSITPEEAQFLETQRFSVEDVARWFRVPPNKIGHLDKSIKANIEAENRSYADNALSPWAARLESEIHHKLLDHDPDLEFKISFQGLVRGDILTRAQVYRERTTAGSLTPNQVRELEDENPGPPELDRYYMQGAMVPLENLGAEQETGTETATEGSGQVIAPADEESEQSAPPAQTINVPAVIDAVFERHMAKEQRFLKRISSKNWDASAKKDKITDFYNEQYLHLKDACGAIGKVFLQDVESKIATHFAESRRDLMINGNLTENAIELSYARQRDQLTEALKNE